MQRAYLILLVRDALAREGGELGVEVEVWRGAVLLTGTVPSEEQRARLAQVARLACDPHRVVNEIRVQPPEAAGAPESLA